MKNIVTLFIAALLSFPLFAQTKVGDATLPNTITIESKSLKLNGAGLREKFWFDLYACGLYLTNKNTLGSSITKSDKPMAIHLEILSRLLSKKKMIGAFKDGFENTNSTETVNKLNTEFTTFLGFLKDEIKVGDIYLLVYSPENGTTLLKNDTKLGNIKGLLFKTAIFNIWLSKTPVDNDLKSELLSINK